MRYTLHYGDQDEIALKDCCFVIFDDNEPTGLNYEYDKRLRKFYSLKQIRILTCKFLLDNIEDNYSTKIFTKNEICN